MARIYNFADFQIERRQDTHGWTCSFAGKQAEECPHRNLLFDENGHTVECKDCGKEVSAWWAFMSVVERYEHEWERIKTAKEEIAKAEARILTHKAAIAVEDAWRRRKYIPTCPHCKKPILPSENFGAWSGFASREYYDKEAKPLEFKPKLTIVETDSPLDSPDSGHPIAG